jgi:hypothetical protein
MTGHNKNNEKPFISCHCIDAEKCFLVFSSSALKGIHLNILMRKRRKRELGEITIVQVKKEKLSPYQEVKVFGIVGVLRNSHS